MNVLMKFQELLKFGTAVVNPAMWPEFKKLLAGHRVDVIGTTLDGSSAKYLQVYHNRPCKGCQDKEKEDASKSGAV